MSDFNPSSLAPADPSLLSADPGAVPHLLRRAGFMPSLSELTSARSAGVPALVDSLLAAPAESDRAAELDRLGESIAARNDIAALRAWWFSRLRHTARPLQARLALFWHNHFATSNAKIQSAPLMLRQLRTIESLAPAPFAHLLLALCKDPAMLLWLDGNANAKGRPNENFARELFELFTLGPGNYTETDIREAARAYTGWHTRAGRFHFSSVDHDSTGKTILGQSGNFTGDDVIRIALAQPACARFLAAKLLHEFLTPSPSEDLLNAAADSLRNSNYHLSAFLRTLFLSQAFFAPQYRGSRIKSPVEFVVGLVRSLEVAAPASTLADAASQMGQRLFEPPSVKGWDGHRTWLNSATLLVRLNALDTVLSAQPEGDIRFNPAGLLAAGSSAGLSPSALAQHLADTGCPSSSDPPPSDASSVPLDAFLSSLRTRLFAAEYQMC